MKNKTNMSISFADMPITKEEVYRVLDKSDQPQELTSEEMSKIFENHKNNLFTIDSMSLVNFSDPYYRKHYRTRPTPVGKGVVRDIIKYSYGCDANIWKVFTELGYNAKFLKKEKRLRKISMVKYLGAHFPKPILEKMLNNLKGVN